MNNHAIRTMQCLLDRLPELGYSDRTTAQIRPQIKRCGQIYNAPLNRIPADLDAFETRWGEGRVGIIAAGFASRKQFGEWRRRVRQALRRALEERSEPAPIRQEWTEILDFVKQVGGVGKRLPPHLELSVGVVARTASAVGLAPKDLDPSAVDQLIQPLKSKRRRSFRRGVISVNMMINRAADLPEIAHLLPATALPMPAAKLTRACPWRRSGPEEAAVLWAEFDEFVAAKRGRDALGRPIPPADSPFGRRAAQSYEHTLNAAMNELARAGVLRPGDAPTLREICSRDAIETVTKSWSRRQIDGEVSRDASTLHSIVCRLGHIATHLGAKKRERKAIGVIRTKVRKASPAVGRMSPPREAWIRSFAESRAQQRALHAMPETLMSLAQPILDDWPARKRGRKPKTMMRALSLGIAAAQATILFGASPLRAVNLRCLTFRGEGAQVIRGAAGNALHLLIPAGEIKNGNPIDTAFDDDAAPILDWYCGEIRPRLITDHPYGVQMVDSDYLFPSTGDRPLEETAFAGHFRCGVEAAGLDLTLHQARHICAFLILDSDPNAWGQAAAVLGDTVETVRKHYAWLDDRKACRAGREVLQASRANIRKHRKGLP